MRCHAGLLLCVLPCAAVLAAGAAAGGQYGLPFVGRRLLEEQRRWEVVRARHEVSARALQAKGAAGGVTGRLSLREAAAEFRLADGLVEDAAPGLVPPPT